jgi:hypothetical protein
MEKDYLICSCGKPAKVIFDTENFGWVPWCGETPIEYLTDALAEGLQAAQEDSPPDA